VIFIETPIFTAAVKELLDDDAYGQLQSTSSNIRTQATSSRKPAA
jgi:hypothetical protein